MAENIPKQIENNNVQIQDFCTLCRKITKLPPDNVAKMKAKSIFRFDMLMLYTPRKQLKPKMLILGKKKY